MESVDLTHIHTDTEEDTPAIPSSATQRAFDELRQRIIHGDIAPGEKLKVESLKSLLDVGASPIREALSLLTSDQLVERLDQRGFRAAPANKKQFLEILMLRCQLDDIALRSSIAAGDESWEENLLLSNHRLAKADRKDLVAWESRHKTFHTTLLSACSSTILLKFCDQLYDLNIRYRFLAGRSNRYSQRNVAQEHKDIMEAAIARDANTASQLLAKHYNLTGDFLANQFQD
jgi:DNA-binding GntR family transcriptional regulator